MMQVDTALRRRRVPPLLDLLVDLSAVDDLSPVDPEMAVR
jgi:hypothetical protein